MAKLNAHLGFLEWQIARIDVLRLYFFFPIYTERKMSHTTTIRDKCKCKCQNLFPIFVHSNPKLNAYNVLLLSFLFIKI